NNVSLNDFDPDTTDVLTVSTTPLTGPSHGALTLNPDGTFTYVPDAGFTGQDMFSYIICDNGTPGPLCDTAQVTIHVLPPSTQGNNPPVAVDDATFTTVNNPVSGNLLLNDYDPDGDSLIINLIPLSGPSHGTVTIHPDGSYTYTPDPGYVGPDNFTYVVCDNGVPVKCDTATAYITILPVLPCIDGVVSNVTCNGSSDGAIDITVSCGVPPFSYIWSTGDTTEDLGGLAAGTYILTVTDVFGNASVDTFVVTEPQALNLNVFITDVSCNGSSDGSIDLTVSGGTPPYSYLWSNSATTEDLTGLSSGSYTVTVTDANGCTATLVSAVVIDEPSAIQLTAVASDASCNGSNDGSIDLTVSGGTPPYSYLWSNSATTEDLTGLSAGSYTVTVTDANGCTASTTLTVGQSSSLSLTGVVSDALCKESNDGSIDLTISGGIMPYNILWSNGATTEDISNLFAGVYTVVVTDSVGCVDSASFTVNEPDLIVITLTTLQHVSCFGSNDGAVEISVTGGVPPYSYLWSTGDTTPGISGLSPGTYSLTVTDANNCQKSITTTINTNQQLNLTISTTPPSCYD
ncbi:MAG: tandem-95 repeat protein, partial [Chloroflexi bacterium]